MPGVGVLSPDNTGDNQDRLSKLREDLLGIRVEPEPPADRIIVFVDNIFRKNEKSGLWRDVLGLEYSWAELAADSYISKDEPMLVLTVERTITEKANYTW